MVRTLVRLLAAGAVIAAGVRLGGFEGAYYRVLESAGVHKRDILVDRVRAAQSEQGAAKEQFTSAMEHFAALAEFDGGDLGKAYENADAEYQQARARAGAVRERIDGVKSVGEALFAEWQQELGEYQNADLRAISERRMVETRARYEEMVAAMGRAEETMEPVLRAFNDDVLFLKHNLNAEAVGSLDGNLTRLQADIATLIGEMEASMEEADRFVGEMRVGGAAGG